MPDTGNPMLPGRDGFSVPIPCPECGKKAPQSLAWLIAHDKLTCSGCSFVIDLKSEKISALIEKSKQVFNLRWGSQKSE